MTPEEEPWHARLGVAVAEARKRIGLRQIDLADRLGLTRSSVANLERGRQAPSAYTVARLHGLLGLELEGVAPADDSAYRMTLERLEAENREMRRRLRAVAVALGPPNRSDAIDNDCTRDGRETGETPA